MARQNVRRVKGGKVLCLHQGAVGDLVLTLPALHAIRNALKPRQLVLMAHPWTAPLAQGYPYADALIDCNMPDMAPFFMEEGAFPSAMCEYLGLFATAFYFGSNRTLVKNLHRAGIPMVYTLPCTPHNGRHIIHEQAHCLRIYGINVGQPTLPQIYIRTHERRWAEEFLATKGWRGEEIVTIHPGAGSPKKAWPPDRFAALVKKLATEGRWILLIEGPADRAAVTAILKGLEGTHALVVRGLEVRRVATLISISSLFIGNDAGCTHMAAAVGVPTIALFGPTDPRCWAPLGPHVALLQAKIPCAPCGNRGYNGCQRQLCLEAIEVEAVLRLIASHLRWLQNQGADKPDGLPKWPSRQGWQKTSWSLRM